MDTKNRNSNHLRKRKSGRDNGKQEMFVLPPDVLKKLGISIGNINGNQVFPPDASVAQSTEISNENVGNLLAKNNKCIKESPDSSILETASLMKKSVFLSPTFVSTVANVIPGEVEILSKNNADSYVDEPDSALALSSFLGPVDNIEVTDLVLETSYIQNACQDINVNEEYTSVKDLDQEYPNMAPSENKEAVTNVNLNFHENINNLDYSYENMVPLQCNTDIIFTQNTTEVNNVLKLSEESIVTEETMPLSKLRDLKILHSLNINNPSEEINEDTKSTNKAIPLEAPDTTKLINSNEIASDVNTYNNNNLEITDINNYVHTNVATSPIYSQTIEMENDENYKDPVIRDVYKHIEMDKSDKKTKIGEEQHSEQAWAEGQFNENSPIVENYNGIDKHNDHDDDNVYSDTNKVDTFLNTNPSNMEEQPEVNNIENHIPALNEHECNMETRENSICLVKETNNVKNSTKCSLKNKPRRKSNSKQQKHSKSIVENKCDSSTFKNIEVSTVPDEGLANILSRTKELSSNDTDGKVDQVKEIAAYLKKFSHIYKDKDKLKKEFGKNYINKKQNTNSNISAITSKLCIQGVEKPGGKEADKNDNDEPKVLKTYSRRNQQSKLSTDILHTHETCNKVDVLDDELNTVNIPMPNEIQEFCSCYDFGRLAYYDDDNLYEHIHLLQHTSVDCELELLFAIYNDEESESVVNKYESGLEQEQVVEDKGGANAHKVCWSIFQDEHTEIEDNSDAEQTCHNYEVNKFNNNCKDSLQETELKNVALKDTIDHDMVNWEKLSRENQDDEINLTAVPSAGIKNVNANISTSADKLVLTSTPVIGLPEMNNVNSKVVAEQSGDKERRKSVIPKRSINEKYTYSKRSQYLESKNNANKDPIEVHTPKAIKNATLKRKITEDQTPPSHTNNKDEPSTKKNIKCGLCNTLLSEVEWEDHISQQHNMIAWKSGSSINFDDPDLLDKLKDRLKTLGMLKCSICKMKTRKLKKFIAHVKECVIKFKDSNSNKKSDKPSRKSRIIDEKVTCGVCQKTMLSSSWIKHIGKHHFYLAWSQGQPALNLEDEAVVRNHLQKIVRLNGCLTCYKCGFTRSRVNLYQRHIQTCDGSGLCLEEESTSVDLDCTSNVEEQEQVVQPDLVINVKCGVCKEDVDNLNWIEHIAKKHNYMAWQEGDTPLNLDDEEAVWNHLQQFIRQNGGLTCHKCGLNRKRVKLYLSHIETCDGTNSQADTSVNNVRTDQWFEVPIVSDDRKVVKCAVCSQEVPILEWVQHIGKEHNYLAWQEGSKPLVLDDEMEIRPYLLEVSKQIGGLICNKCEKKIKYPKTFLQHLTECTGKRVSLDSSKLNKSVANNSSSNEYSLSKKKIKIESVTCGVCATVVEIEVWMDHLQKVHQYMAWIEGQPPLDVENAEMLQKHLYDISKTMGGLVCMKCGVRRKYVKTYQQHVETCQGEVCGSELNISLMSRDILECAICNEKVVPKDWRNHAMTKHYNIAWVVGDVPIELNNPYAVENYIKQYLHKYNKLVCKVCGISRVSCVGFYAHIITCGKTEQEMEMYKSVCEICHNKYLRIYKSQHMTMHREAEYALERKLLAAKEKELKKEEPVEVVIGSRRKAAERAKTVIEKYKNGCNNSASNYCSKCGFNSEIEKELVDHVCVDNWGDATDSDESVQLDGCSEDETDETDVDSNVSDEELEAREQVSHKKKRWSDNNYPGGKIARLPYQVKSNSAYMKKSAEEFIEKYLTDEDIFTQWRNCKIEPVLENELKGYMPPIEESCKFRLDENQDWMSFNRFESQKIKDTIVLFAGASIQCMSWVPSDRAGGAPQYVCVSAHVSADVPRQTWDRTLAAPALIQIWDCGNLISTLPKLVLGIAHDYGTVWAIDWCPSGARDLPDFVPEENKMHRLGLLATACSNGSAYIFLVPYPSSITEEEKKFYKLKPVAELRLVSNGNRKAYQASAIKWSTQKGHSHVVVGYADGTTAYYDLNGESPILKTTENDMTVFYPYHDERVQNSCIEDVDMYPAGDGGDSSSGRAGGVVCVGSAGGAGAGALQSHLAAGRVLFPPHWPAALLAGDDCLVNLSINELEWWGGGRRLGGVQHAAGCAWCGRVVSAALPLLRLMRLHPCFADVHKQVIGTLQMVPLGSKRKRQTDELAMIVEPITYSESVKKYGIELKQITTRDRVTQQKLASMPRDAFPERFPLSDVAALQFCPTFKHHHKLALATHAGLVFIMNV